jgi:hypothetical protein
LSEICNLQSAICNRMRRWKPQPSALLWLAVVALLAAAAGAGWLLQRLLVVLLQPPASWPVSGALFLQFVACLALLLLAGAFAYRLAAALTLNYSMDRNGLYINWLGNRAVVPLQQIESVESGVQLPSSLADRLRSLGYRHGRTRTPEGRVVHRFSTLPLQQALIVRTAADAYAISPQDASGFVQDLEQRRRLGAIQPLTRGVETGSAFSYAFWDNRVVRAALGLAVVLNLALLGWLMTIYPTLPAMIDLRANAAGVADSLVPRHQILFLPLAGAALGFMNVGLGLSFFKREPLGAQLLQLATVGVQLLFAVAALTIVR